MDGCIPMFADSSARGGERRRREEEEQEGKKEDEGRIFLESLVTYIMPVSSTLMVDSLKLITVEAEEEADMARISTC